MTDKVFHFVRHHEVPAYERIGWQRHDSLDGTHHGQWSALMEWKGLGEPVKPFRLDPPPRETNDDTPSIEQETLVEREMERT